MTQPYKKRITVKQLAELLLSQPPEVQEKEVQYADFSWEFPEDVRVCSGQFDDMVTIVGG